MAPEHAGILYIDGHVRVYNGQQTKLPRHLVACQRLCLRTTTDDWVNAMDGQPFFMINKAVAPETQSKHFIDTIKMIAYRAETALANLLRETISRSDEVRSLL